MATLTTEDPDPVPEGKHAGDFLLKTYEQLVRPRIIEEKMLSRCGGEDRKVVQRHRAGGDRRGRGPGAAG
jgi:hypothetical protein